MELYEKRVSGETRFKGRMLTLRVDQVELPSGRIASREVCDHPGGAAVLAVDRQGRCALVRQFRYPVGETLWEIPAGKLDHGAEDPLEGAKRELKEETGLVARDWTYLGPMYPSPGCLTETLHLYLARDLVEGEQMLDEDEFLNMEFVPLSRVEEMAARGEIRDGKTLAAFYLAGLRGNLEARRG